MLRTLRLLRSSNIQRSFFSTTTNASKPPTAVLMMNMGGPSHTDDVEFFLTNLFTDPEIIPMGPVQSWLGPRIAKNRTPKIVEQYSQIGGGSPIRHWSDKQGEAFTKILDDISPDTAPHKHYIAFRYADPLTENAIDEMKRDGVTRAVAFSQYPQYSCTTTGSSLNHLWRCLKSAGMQNDIKWSIIDRWPLHSGFIAAVKDRILAAVNSPESKFQNPPLVLFSAHSLPQKVKDRGDTYADEVAATVHAVMASLQSEDGVDLSYKLAWQSKVGYLPWLAPSTENTIKSLGKAGVQDVLVVPIAFTSDHIETLFEIDIEYAEVAHESNVTRFARAESLNDSPVLAQAQAEIVKEHLASKRNSSPLYHLQCVACANPSFCRALPNPAHPTDVVYPGNPGHQ